MVLLLAHGTILHPDRGPKDNFVHAPQSGCLSQTLRIDQPAGEVAAHPVVACRVKCRGLSAKSAITGGLKAKLAHCSLRTWITPQVRCSLQNLDHILGEMTPGHVYSRTRWSSAPESAA